MWGFIEIVVFLFFYWLFYPRVRAMAEVIMTRANEVLDHLMPATSSKDALKQKQIQQLGTIGTPRPTAYHNKVSRIMSDKALDRQIKRQRLANIKNIPRIITTSSHKPSIPDCCEKCSPSSKSLMIETLRNFGARNFLQVDEELQSSSWIARQFCHLRAASSVPTHYFPQVVTSVLKDERLLKAVEMSARMDSNDSARNGEPINSESTNGEYSFKSFLERNHKRAEDLLMSMRSTMSNSLLRFISWLVYKLLPKLLPSCVGHPEQFEMLRKASETGLPLIFLPLHRSHVDYIVVTFILLMNKIKPPLVAAGDNLKIPFFGWLLRGLGAFYIKRRIDPVQGRKDIVYRAVLHTYMLESLRAGYNIEFFIEGGRTRTGKPCMPKAGLLSVIIDAYLDGTIEDALLVPVAINYDRLVDGNFVREQLGQPKKMESFTSAVSAIWQVFRSSYGMLRIDFNPPFSLKELMRNSNLHANGFTDNQLTNSYDRLHEVPSSTSLYGSDYVSTEQRDVVDRIARHIVYDSARSMAIMSTNLLSYTLLYRHRNGGTRETIAADMDFLRREIACKDCDLGFSGDSIDVIDHAIQVLGPALVRREGERIIPVTLLPNVIELAYYANTMVYLLSLDSVIATVIGSIAAITGNNDFKEDELVENALGLCDILQYEFIFCRPCQNIKQSIYDTLDSFVARGLIIRDCEELSEDEMWSKKFAKHFESSDDEETSQNKVDYSTYSSSNMKELISMQCSLSPFIDAYTVSALCLCGLVDRQVTERDLIQEILAETKNQFDLGISRYGESLSSDSIRGSLKLFERWGVLECQHEGKNKLYYLNDSYDNDTEIRKVLERIHKYKL